MANNMQIVWSKIVINRPPGQPISMAADFQKCVTLENGETFAKPADGLVLNADKLEMLPSFKAFFSELEVCLSDHHDKLTADVVGPTPVEE